jgi:hypothetical protein
MRKPEDLRRLINKIIIVVFLVLLVIGFTVPTLLNNDSSSQKVPQRVCQSDADCYLMCEDKPVQVLCSQNLCWQNSCEEGSSYQFNSTPNIFRLSIDISGEKINLASKANPGDIFVKYDSGNMNVFARGLSLDNILEKFGIRLNSNCITINESYCNSDGHKLEMLVYGEPAYVLGGYVPNGEELIEIRYE